jgi:GH3 auxin-responsive promoter
MMADKKMSHLSRALIPFMGRRAAKRFEAETLDPVRAQQRRLAEIIEKNRGTAYGRAHDFGAIQSVADWRKRVPVVTYEDLRPWIDLIGRGEENVLTAEVPLLFARTSGTTAEPKLIPITRTCRRDHGDQIRTWFFHAWRDHPSIWRKKILSLVSPAVEGTTPSGIPYGSASGHIYRGLPRIVRSTYAIPYEVFEIRDWYAQVYAIMRIGIAEDIRFVGTANPSSILKLCEVADERSESLLSDLAQGTLSSDLELPPRMRALVERQLKPMPGRARALAAARSRRGGRLLPADYWPDLALIGCWKGGTVGAHVDRFGAWFDPDGTRGVPVRDWGWLSSEARGSIPVSDQGRGGVLTVGTSFYEFVDADEVEADPEGAARWRFRGVDELDLGDEYYVFLTTNGGLYRYDINDVVAVTGKHHETPLIEFRRKGRGVTSLTGEKVSVTQIVEAFDAAARGVAVSIDHFKAEADPDGIRYVFKVEAKGGIPQAARAPLLQALDDELSRRNLEYLSKRKSRRLNGPLLHIMRPGWYDAEKRRLVDAGQRMFQAKTVILVQQSLTEDSDVEAVVSLDDQQA